MKNKKKIMSELNKFNDIRAEITQKQFDAICKKYSITKEELNGLICEANGGNIEGLVL
jgi:hypothetical protein